MSNNDRMVKSQKVLWKLYSISMDDFFSAKRMMGILNKYNLISIILNKYKDKLECWKHKAETGNYNLKIFSVKNI